MKNVRKPQARGGIFLTHTVDYKICCLTATSEVTTVHCPLCVYVYKLPSWITVGCLSAMISHSCCGVLLWHVSWWLCHCVPYRPWSLTHWPILLCIRAVPDCGSGRNLALFPNPAPAKIPPEPDCFAGFEKSIFLRHWNCSNLEL